MKPLSLHILTKITLIIILINNSLCLQEKIKFSYLKRKTLMKQIEIIRNKMKESSNNKKKLGLTCKNHKDCKQAVNYLKYSFDIYKQLFFCVKKNNSSNEILNKTDVKDLDLSSFYELIIDINADKLDCFMELYYYSHYLIDWILIAKDLKNEFLTMFEKTLHFLDYEDVILEAKEMELNAIFKLINYIMSYISYEQKNYNKIGFLFSLYVPDNKDNKLLKMESTIKKHKTYLHSPYPLKFDNNFLNVLKQVKEQAEISKVILIVIDTSYSEFNGHYYYNLDTAGYYFSSPFSTFTASKIDINDKEEIKKYYGLNNNVKMEDLSHNIHIIKLEPLHDNKKSNLKLDNNVIFSVVDSTIDKPKN